ncbi:MAG: DUF3821 domain-containing protein [Methanoculleaceae archaeon]
MRSIPICLLSILISGALFFPAVSARGPLINDIQPGDTIFVYERGLNLTGLASDVRWLVHYTDLNTGTFDNRIPVSDPASFELLESFVDGIEGAYYAWNDSGLIESRPYVMIRTPEVSIEPVLASDHSESIREISVPTGTAIAFRISAPEVGSMYHVDSNYPASVDIVITMPGGSRTTMFGGSDLGRITIDAPEIYTDDVRAATTLDGLNPGKYSACAEWNTPQCFADYAPASDPIDFIVEARVSFTETPTPAVTEETTVPTTIPPTTTAVPATPSPTPSPTVTPSPSATPSPAAGGSGLYLAVLACGVIALLRRRPRGGRKNG